MTVDITADDLAFFFRRLQSRMEAVGASRAAIARSAGMKPSQLSSLFNSIAPDPRRSTMIRLLQAVEEAEQEREAMEPTLQERVGATIDLMEALKQSLAAAKGKAQPA
jgi:transcriptional regulator with XRE-family HTH domain